jgi:predicted nucleic acid-binding protein
VSRILLDTNVVLRLADRDAPEHELVRTALQTLDSRGDSLVLAPQVLVEFWVVATRPADVNGFGWAPEVVGEAIRRLRARFELLAEGPQLFEQWMALVVRHNLKGKRAHDARLAAIALVHSVDRILTLNITDFAGIDGIAGVHPTGVS